MAGRPKRVTDEEILRKIALARGPVVTAPELSEKLDMGVSGINKRLDSLVEEELIHQREVGASAVVYWLSESGRDTLAQSD